MVPGEPSVTAPASRPAPPAGYLDAASGEPLHPAARAAWLAAVDDGWADPSRLYASARRARLLLDGARESVAAVLGCRADEVSFAASGTQAVHLGVAGLALGRRRTGAHAVASAVEHSAVLHALRAHEATGGSVDLVGVDAGGRVDPRAYAATLRPDTAFACLQPANQEVGTAQPLATVAEACAVAEVPLLVDAAQSVGRGPLPAGWSVLTASAHKWGGPPGVGVLAVRTGVRWRAPLPADDRSSDPRVPGFEDVPAVVAAAAALEAVAAGSELEEARLRGLSARLRERVPALVPDTVVLGDPDRRLAHVAAFSLLYVEGEALLGELDAAGFAVGSGSACSSSALEPSHVLVAMGALTHGNLRVSLPRGVAETDVERLLAVLPAAVARVRDRVGAADL
jgi:cysteine desulfurase